MNEKEEEYFAVSKDGKRGIISIKCWDDRRYFIKDLRTFKVKRCESFEEAERKLNEPL